MSHVSDFVVPEFSPTSRCSVLSGAAGLLHLRKGADAHNSDHANLTAAEQNVSLQNVHLVSLW